MSDGAPILHMLTPLGKTSPFDVNMAVDAGFSNIAYYTGVGLRDVAGLTQDAMFSRSPDNAKRTVIFFGGKDASLALDQMAAAGKALFPPFEISLFADPSGAFTTAAAMIAQVEKHLKGKRKDGLKGAKVQIYGATGIIGGIAAVIAAQAGAKVTIVSHLVIEDVEAKAVDFKKRFKVKLDCAVARNDEDKKALVRDAEVILTCASAGVEVISKNVLKAAENLLVGADINAVPPNGIAGVDSYADGAPLPHGVGIGALTIGQTKYQVQHRILKRLCETDVALRFGIIEAYELARSLTA
ncbi:methylenetetrahydromethanopterin dehydrogenase [Chelatococcus sambhunathii]|uniref:Methylenetetrahydromethanopterin dehydrogenase n=1 Tax=Chelatococcus sambhunathii TaxID=363953 RepID=A0ABU1DIA1_9HYPH|nr:methylenetetrahydromethanopterin dehydrogenase [Chelatococcus sambhunathii]MDR4307822.1 methylenetetrahydromethanopterin dehydrogenase [Chelatococcus sambhunathii]